MQKETPPWTAPVSVDDIPETGLHVDLDAPVEARAAIAKLADLRDLPALSAAFDLTRKGAGVHVAGTVDAKVGQTCVVTLDPIESKVAEAVDVVFAPGGSDSLKADGDAPEPLVGNTIDLGVLATEFLLLGIDPYPRKPGVEFAAPKAEASGEHPFAALATLKKRLGGGKS